MELMINANVSHALYYATHATIHAHTLEKKLRALYPSCIRYSASEPTAEPYLADMQIVDKFLKGGSQTTNISRFFLPALCPNPQNSGFEAVCIMLTFFKDTDILSLSFHYSLKDIGIDRLIALRQSGIYAKHRFAEEEISFADLADHIITDLGIPRTQAEQSFLTEITRFGDHTDLDHIEAEYASTLYGIITGDEGYAFVPSDMIKERLSCTWGSRNFIRIYALGQGFLFFNLLSSPQRQEYLARQTQFGTDVYGGADPYFFLGSSPLSVNHGIWFAIEFVIMLKALINDVVAFQTQFDQKKILSYFHRIRMTQQFRKKIISVLEKVENTAIHEIGNLSALLMESQHIAPIVDQVKYHLELLESDLSLTYSERNNLLVTVLTVLGLILAVWQVVLAL